MSDGAAAMHGADDAGGEAFWQLEFALPSAHLDDAEACLWDCACVGVSAVPAADAPDLFEPDPGTTPLWHDVRVLALFLDPEAAQAAALALRAHGFVAAADADAGTPTFSLSRVVEGDWQHAWRQHVQPRCFGGPPGAPLWVCPSDARTPEMGGRVVLLDGGLAFGTGSHATTALCLEWLAHNDVGGARVVDFGCGSGILGIAALVLGAASVHAVDHDPQALRATQDNARLNDVGERLACVDADALAPASADVLLANILAGTLVELAPRLRALLAPGARIVLSGVLASQAAGVMAAYPDVEFEPVLPRDDWVCIAGRLREGARP